MLDEQQIRLLHLAEMPFGAYSGFIQEDDPLQLLLDKFKFEVPSLLSSSQDEAALDGILAEIIENESQTDKGKKVIYFGLTDSQRYVFVQLKQRKLPLKYLLFTLDPTQRQALLQEVFVGIFQDEEHPNPQEAFAIFKFYVSYFTISNDESPNSTLPFDYGRWFLERRKELSM